MTHLDQSNDIAPLAAYQYEMVWHLLQEPLTAAELLTEVRYAGATPLSMASRLRPLVKRGWIERSPTGIYRATEKARRAVSW